MVDVDIMAGWPDKSMNAKHRKKRSSSGKEPEGDEEAAARSRPFIY